MPNSVFGNAGQRLNSNHALPTLSRNHVSTRNSISSAPQNDVFIVCEWVSMYTYTYMYIYFYKYVQDDSLVGYFSPEESSTSRNYWNYFQNAAVGQMYRGISDSASKRPQFWKVAFSPIQLNVPPSIYLLTNPIVSRMSLIQRVLPTPRYSFHPQYSLTIMGRN